LSDFVYACFRLLGAPFRFDVEGAERIRAGEPGIFVGNHAGSVGPTQTVLSLPVRLYPWVIRDMADYRLAPPYLYDDFIHPTWGLSGRLGMGVSRVVARIAVTMIRSLDSVPVDGDDDRVISAFRRSMALLKAGRLLLIFPEDPKQPVDPTTEMRPFKAGAALLSRLYQESVGKPLPVYPLAIAARRRLVVVGVPLYGEDGLERRAGVGWLRERLYRRVAEMVMELERPLDL